MHSLFLRIFLLFWIAMALMVGCSIAITFAIAAREYGSPELQRRPGMAIQASEVLASGGISALKKWLEANEHAIPDRDLFITAPDGKDILGRRLSEGAARRLEFFNGEAMIGTAPPGTAPPGVGPPAVGPPAAEPWHLGQSAPGNFRPPRAAPQIVGPDGATYTVLLVPRRASIFGALSLPGISLTILGIALAVSAFASWWLAQHLSAPIRRIQAGARALAGENLEVRVSAGLEGRKDELAVLARDFDAMADQLRSNRGAVTRLLRDISHELRSPLARMRVALGLARQSPADLPRQLDRLENEIERLDGLISQVLKLARLHGSEAPFARDKFDIDEVLEEVVRDANFEGAVENVLRNAVRYSPAGGLVDVTVERSGGGLSILITDRGPGVPESDLERIFEPFYRVAESRDRDTGGEGIGLAITSQVMIAHGGSATAKNHIGGGLEVLLRLPHAATT